MSFFKILREVAEEQGYKLNVLDNGAVIVVKDGVAIVQIAAVRDAYYFRYLNDNGAYVVYKMSKKILKKILERKPDEAGAVRIPDV